MTLIKVEDLSKVYVNKKEKFHAISNINFSIDKGKTLALVGESGSGKSTTAKVMLRLTPKTNGKVFFKDKNIFDYSLKDFKKFREKMQIIFQDPFASLNPRMTVKEIIEEPLKIHKKYNIKKVKDIVSLVQLPISCLNKYPHEFSGGQRQRIGIARSLCLNPEFLILDEPVSALDVSIQAQILNLLKELQKELNLTYLLITHDFAIVYYFSDSVAVMNNGKIVEQNLTEKLFSSPAHPYTKKLLDAVKRLERF